MTRQIESWAGLAEVVAMNMPKAIVNRQPSNVGRRPIRSATPPSSTEPTAMPTSSMDRTKPNAWVVICHSAAIPLLANAMDRMSNPSIALSITVIATTITIPIVIGDWSIMDRGSFLSSVPPFGEEIGPAIMVSPDSL